MTPIPLAEIGMNDREFTDRAAIAIHAAMVGASNYRITTEGLVQRAYEEADRLAAERARRTPVGEGEITLSPMMRTALRAALEKLPLGTFRRAFTEAYVEAGGSVHGAKPMLRILGIE